MGGNTYQDHFPDVYGISGKKRHGKDTLAKFIMKTRAGDTTKPEFRVIHFAGELKRQAAVVFGLGSEQLDGSLKEAPLLSPVVMDNFLSAMSDAAGLDIKEAGCIAYTPREIMQYLGTEYVRRARDSYWIDVVLDKISTLNGTVLVPDTRFPNEADALRSVGGKIIKVHRLDLADTGDGHSSETAMEKIDPDLLLGTMTDNFGLQSRVSLAISTGFFTTSQRFDYRKVERALAEFRGGANTRDVAEQLSMSLAEAEFVLDYYKVNCQNCRGYRYFDDKASVWQGQLTEHLVACNVCNLNPDAQRLS